MAMHHSSCDSRYIVYETGVVPARRVRIAATADPLSFIAELKGQRAAFSTD